MSRIGASFGLRERIAQLDGSGVTQQGAWSPSSLIDQRHMQFVRLHALRKPSPSHSNTLLPFIRGLWTLQSPWSVMATGQGGQLSIHVGAASNRHRWSDVLAATLTGARIESVADASGIARTIQAMPWLATLSGNPSVDPGSRITAATPSGAGDVLEQTICDVAGPIEVLSGALQTSSWAYVVFARPLAEGDVRARLRRVQEEERELVSSFQRRGSAEEQNNPLAQHLRDLLNAAHRQLEMACQTGMWNVGSCLLAADEPTLATAAHAATAALSRGRSAPQPIRCLPVSQATSCPTTTLNSIEASAYAALPREERVGVALREAVTFSVNSPAPLTAQTLACGVVLDHSRQTGNWFEVDRDDLARHAFICGGTGSGKTRTCQQLLLQLWLEHRVPWLVIEPALKCEYRSLLTSRVGSDLQIYGVGSGNAPPLAMNPLERPAGIGTDAHIDALVALFSAAFGLTQPLPYLMRVALQQVFQDVAHPTVADLHHSVRTTVAARGYTGELAANIKAAMELRLEQMLTGVAGRVLNVRSSTPTDRWLTQPTIVELSGISDEGTRALLMGTLLLRLSQERQRQGMSQSLRHVAVLEEAHRILGRRMSGTSEHPDVGAHAGEAFAQLLCEVRAFGQALFVVDQSPAKMLPDVLRNTQLKLVHRLTSGDDHDAIAAAMALTPAQTKALTALGVGEAIAFGPRSQDPCHIAVPDWRRSAGTTLAIPDDTVVALHTRNAFQEPEQASSRSVGAGCCDCPNDQACELGRKVRLHLARRDCTSDLNAAMTGGLDDLRRFAARIAMEVQPQDYDASTSCVVLQLARAVGATPATVRQLAERLRADDGTGSFHVAAPS